MFDIKMGLNVGYLSSYLVFENVNLQYLSDKMHIKNFISEGLFRCILLQRQNIFEIYTKRPTFFFIPDMTSSRKVLFSPLLL
jgi:hypothetical protein